MIILELKCGLGNQLFEYAYARSLLKRLNKQEKIYLSLSAFRNEPDGRSYKLDNFFLPKDTEILSPCKQTRIAFKYRLRCKAIRAWNKLFGKNPQLLRCRLLKAGIYDWNFESIEDIYKGKTHFLMGVFQDYRRFNDIKSELKKIFTIKRDRDVENSDVTQMMKQIQGTQSFAMHIRRGDYVSNERWKNELLVCTENYYRQAFLQAKEMLPDAHFFVFSNGKNDIDWIKENYVFLNCPSVTFVECSGDDIDDFELMTSCKNHIISNSSFSWWAQYLCDNEKQLVFAPSYWDTSRTAYDGIYMKHWICIEP